MTTLQATIDIPFERIVNCVIGFVENGYSPWAGTFTPRASSELIAENVREVEKGIWYSTEIYWQSAGLASLEYDHPDDDEGTFGGSITIGLPEFTKGLAAMSAKAPTHFANLVSENDDAIAHDVFMQMVVFGEIIYG